jgi:riboflavin kinase/FMN adenylyltransferase
MKIFRDISEIPKYTNTVLTVGTFDGVHKGHQKIINEVVNTSKNEALRNLVITFWPHPRKVLFKDSEIKLLTSQQEQKEILSKLGVENLLVINFTKSFSEITSYQFVKDFILDKIGLKKIIIGYDHHFGKARQGNVNFLKSISKDLNFDVVEIEPLKIDSNIVSSSLIRTELLNGNINLANKLLGREYSFTGTVVHGDGRGRELGYPTANILLDEPDKLLPKLGIYAVYLFIDEKKYKGLLSVGRRPTFYNNGDIVPEVYIYDFNMDIYNKKIKVEILEKLRDEEKFNSAEELINQMNIDKQNGLEIFNKLNQSNN